MLAAAAIALLLDGAGAPPPQEPAPPAIPTAEASPAPAGDAPAAGRTPIDDLVPTPLDDGAIAALLQDLAVPPSELEAAATLAAQYAQATGRAHASALREVGSRIAAATRPAAQGAPPTAVDGPERIAMLEAAAGWRRALAAADDAYLRRLLPLRSDAARRCNGLVLHDRAVARDGAAANDPAAALRLADLVDAAGLDADAARKVTDALDRHWAAIAAAVSARRSAIDAAALERARLAASWGPAWRAGADEATVAARLAQLDAVDARAAQADLPLRRANRDAALALVRMLGPAAGDRVLDAADRSIWPWLYAADRRLEDAAGKASELGGTDVADGIAGLRRELAGRLGSTRRELGRRAAALEDAAAAEDAEPGPERAAAHLDAMSRLLELRAKRLRELVDSGTRMLRVAAADPRAKAAVEDALASVQAQQRTVRWELDGTLARLAELGAAPAAGEPGAAPAKDGAPAPR